jgi:hypothetical protein
MGDVDHELVGFGQQRRESDDTVSFFSESVPFRWSSDGAVAVPVISTNEMGKAVYLFGV